MNRQQRRQERRRFLAVATRAGITSDEITDHPEHGLLVSQSGLRKLTAIAPNPGPGQYLLEWTAHQRRKQLRVRRAVTVAFQR